ncbi:hypothetical protein IN07_10150 [Modestobacter caceresii]|uniref:Uncharacterized protein n=1 Tax=Modestobacter caceresii TaxID=1522368 RepID=A0A098Y8P2_9ACTN|nr:hypothetical protein IN07_10150 [Modestobacter caceresii]
MEPMTAFHCCCVTSERPRWDGLLMVTSCCGFSVPSARVASSVEPMRERPVRTGTNYVRTLLVKGLPGADPSTGDEGCAGSARADVGAAAPACARESRSRSTRMRPPVATSTSARPAPHSAPARVGTAGRRSGSSVVMLS